MNCERFEALLTDYLEGTLIQEDKAAMDQHMEECAACAQSLADMRMLLQDLTSMDDSVQVPTEWSQSWRQAIRTEQGMKNGVCTVHPMDDTDLEGYRASRRIDGGPFKTRRLGRL